MKRKKIKFRELLNIGGGYDLSIRLEVLNYMLKTGKLYTHRSGWYEYGVDKQIFGYSANNYESKTAINTYYLRLNFLNAILADAPPIVQKWRDENGISLDGSFMLSHVPSTSDCCQFFTIINRLVNKPLKKDFYHPDYTDRLNPYISSVKVFCVGNGIQIEYDFTFDCHPSGGWRGTELRQTENESVSDFFKRALKYFDERLLN